MNDDFAVRLEKLLISEVSGVDAPAHEAPGWMLMKAVGGASAPARKTGLAVAWGEEGSDVKFAVSHEDAPTINIHKRDGSVVTIQKAALGDDGESADPPPSALPESERGIEALQKELGDSLEDEAAQELLELVGGREALLDLAKSGALDGLTLDDLRKSHNRHETQLRDALGKWRTTPFRRSEMQPKLGGHFFP